MAKGNFRSSRAGYSMEKVKEHAGRYDPKVADGTRTNTGRIGQGTVPER